MRILCVATKLPWPPYDGGRLALALTLQGLAEAGNEIRLVAPVYDAERVCPSPVGAITAQAIPLPRSSWPAAAVRALYLGRALSVARHHRKELEQAVSVAVADFRPDVVHAEQLQALANCSLAVTCGIPVVLRMQNVESHIWRQVAAARLLAAPLAFEAARLRVEESRALSVAAQTLTLTENDAHALRQLLAPAASAAIRTIAPAFPSRLPAGRRLDGEPTIALSGSAGWWPNKQANRWLLREVLPLLSRRLPRAVVHVFGGESMPAAGNLRWHPAPAESVDAFPEDAIVAVPLFIGSGIRIRILEAWARGLPVVATSAAARGLDAVAGRELAIADTAEDFCAALCTLARNQAARAALVDAGRAYLIEKHDPTHATQALLDAYGQAIAQSRLVRTDRRREHADAISP